MPGRASDFLVTHLDGRVDTLTDRLVAAIEVENAGYRALPVVPREDLRRSCHDNIVRVLELLERAVAGDPVVAGLWYDAAEETGRRRAAQGLPLDDVLGSFRIGGRLIWEDLVALAERDDRVDQADLRAIGTHLWEVVDRTSSHVARAYHDAERDLVRADEQRSAALWEGLLAGRGREPAFAVAATQTLRLPLHGTLLVVVVSGALDGIDRRLDARGVSSAWHRRTDSVVGILDAVPAGVTAALEVLREGARVRGGVSRVFGQFAEVGDAFGQAVLALRTLEAGEARVVCFDERLVEALLLGAPDMADRLVELWLAPVLRLPPAERRVLMETLQAWVGCGGSMTATAHRANCHRNTAMNRITRIGTLLGRPLTDEPVPVELALALRSLRLAVSDRRREVLGPGGG